ncbi:MAG: pseudouridine synthase, partial [Spirochaetaceae bacterium]|nr:pseudouridine synthase [Spirochaetaceae bacterium]
MARKAETRIAKSDEGQRLLDWLVRRFTYMDADSWERAIETGRLLVDGERSEADRVLRAGEKVSFEAADEREPDVDSRYGVVDVDPDFLVLDKPPFLPCHPGGRFFENSLSRLLGRRYGWVHIATRLDRETSGLVLACRTPKAAGHIQAEFDAGRMRKTYFAIVRGDFPLSAR